MTLLTNLTARMSTADPAPAQVSFMAPDACGHPVTWRQVYGHDPVPGACELCPCSTGVSAHTCEPEAVDSTPAARRGRPVFPHQTTPGPPVSTIATREGRFRPS